ncbi:MAG: Hpt domain-containing protein [Thermoflexales bacterium]|nr:Hpt domain-containing protein [Thermoflexales bacterium]
MANSLDQSLDRIVDWSVLDRWRQAQAEGEANFVQEMIELYLAEASPLLNAIQQAVTSGDAGRLRQVAHTLKGNSKNLGVLQVANLCEALEAKGRHGSLDEAETLLASLGRELERAAQALSSHQAKMIDVEQSSLGSPPPCPYEKHALDRQGGAL